MGFDAPVGNKAAQIGPGDIACHVIGCDSTHNILLATSYGAIQLKRYRLPRHVVRFNSNDEGLECVG